MHIFCGALIVQSERMELPVKVDYKSKFIFYSLQSGRFPCFLGGRELRNKSGRLPENPGGLAGWYGRVTPDRTFT